MHPTARQSSLAAFAFTARACVALVSLAALAAAPAAHAQSCVGDLNGDGAVDGADLGLVLVVWGPCGSCTADLDGNGSVDGADLGILLAGWGACLPTVPSWATLVEAAPDPAIVTDPALREAIAASGLAWRVLDTATQVEMLLVPPGTFRMGCIMRSDSYACYLEELPVHDVTLTRAFYLGRYEVTQSQWVATMGSNPASFQDPSRPVEQVSWNAIQGYLGATGFRLPSEAEWERACRAGTEAPFYNGSTDDGTVGSLAWFHGNTCLLGGGCRTRFVGLKAANALGFHDMLGNVSEWVNDFDGSYSTTGQTDPTGPASSPYRVLRGGFFASDPDDVRSSARSAATPASSVSAWGFRVARNP
jgi:formylglycine-generating enzyme required for sulfatase activity